MAERMLSALLDDEAAEAERRHRRDLLDLPTPLDLAALPSSAGPIDPLKDWCTW